MPLDTQIIEVPFEHGVDQKTDPRWVERGTQTSVLNGRFTKTGALNKRYGSNAISKTALLSTGTWGTVTAGASVEAYKNAPVVSDGSHLFSYSTAKNALFYEDQLPECIAQRTPITQDASGIISADCAATNGYALYAYRALSVSGQQTQYATIVDTATGAQLGPNQILDTSNNSGIRCVATGTDFWTIWTSSSGSLIGSRFRAGSTFTWEAPVTLVTDVGATGQGVFDVCANVGAVSPEFIIAYQNNHAPTNQVAVKRYDQNGSVLASASLTINGGSVGTLYGISARSTVGEMCWVAYAASNGGTTIYLQNVGLDPSALTTTAADITVYTQTVPSPATRHVGVERVNSTTCLVISATGVTPTLWRQRQGASTVGPTRTQVNYTQFSKPFAQGSNVYCMFWHYGDVNHQTFQLVDLIAYDTNNDSAVARPVATVAPRIASNLNSMDILVSPGVASIGNGQYITPITVQQSTSRVNLYQCLLDFQTPARHQGVELGDKLYLAGGVPSAFDGAQVCEIGYTAPPVPPWPAQPPTVTAGGSVDSGTHQYAIVYKWVDARGELVRSAPLFSPNVSTTPGNQTVTIPCWPYGMTTKQDGANFYNPAVTFDVYRNTIVDPATFWQLSADSLETASDPRTLTQVNVIDTATDASILSASISTLYTLGGVLADECPPSLTSIVVHKSRLFGVGDDGTTIWFSKQYISGFAPSFNDQLTIACPDGGPITGLASQDDALIIFKKDRIFRLFGSGPNNVGTNSDFSDFIRVASDVGCTQSRSIVLTPMGVYFRSTQGISLLSRAGEVQYIGRAVEDIVAANPVCTAADIVAPLGEIRFCLSPTVTSTIGVIVVYNYIQNAWAVHQYFDTDQSVSSAIVKGAKAPGGTWAWIGAGGQLSIESPATYLDNTQWVTLQVESAWIKANGISGWGRFKRLSSVAQQASPFGLKMEYAVDLSGTYQPGTTWTDAQIAQNFTTPQVETNMQLGIQKTQAVRFRITDQAPTTLAVGAGQGPVLLGLNLEVGVMPHGKGQRLPANQRG